MPRLEAFTHTAKGDFRQYFNLVIGREVRLGREPADAEWAIPEDRQISAFHARLTWDGLHLTVVERGAEPPQYADPPRNHIYLLDDERKPRQDSVRECVVGPGDPFWIGQTRFVVHNDPPQPDLFGGTVLGNREGLTRAQLEAIAFADPADILKKLERAQNCVRAATSAPDLFHKMLKVVVDALPRADAAAVVHIPPGAAPGLNPVVPAVDPHARPGVAAFGPDGFVPSRTLSLKAIQGRLSCLHLWTPDSPPDVTVHGHFRNQIPWALCAPFQDGSKHALYVAGRVPGDWATLTKPAQDGIVADLTQYQKFAELCTGLMEVAVGGHRLGEQNAVLRRAWPEAIRPHLDDPVRRARLDSTLRVQEREITALVCDLRNYSQEASRNAADLLQAWAKVAGQLDIMSSMVTLKGGVVAGFRGDAVLGFWGWPDAPGGEIGKAAEAALGILARLGNWLLQKKCGLGLTHGRAVVGQLGAHALGVVDLYGPIANLAFRLEAMTKAFGVGVIVTRPVADGVAAADPDGQAMRTRPLGRVRAKGFPDPVEALELYPADKPSLPNNNWVHRQWEAAVGHFTAGKWMDARGVLTDTFPDNPAAQCLLRVMKRHQNTPPADWDGSFAPPPPDGD